MSKTPSFSAHMKPDHLKAVRMVGYALTLGGLDGWDGLSAVLSVRLDPKERAALAFAALKALDPETAHMTAEAALNRGAGSPPSPLVSFMDEAAFWADLAEPDERAAYCLATFNRMPPKRQTDFLQHVQGRAAA